ncbi:hypothetical protein KR084_004567 [Drosophila pseudotakahashii]|nr:hypothetical protein KR084_004567 [Drosophila pseudotakahashii]
MKGDNKDEDRENEMPGISKNSLQLQRSESEPIDKKLKDIKEQKAHFNEMVQSLQNLVTPVTAKTMTKRSNKMMQQDSQTSIPDNMPSAGDAERTESTQLPNSSVQDETYAYESIVNVDSTANIFVMQVDGTHELYTEHSPITEEQQITTMREILVDDGELIILTGSNGDLVYNPADTVAIDINDLHLFVVDAQESLVSFVDTSAGQHNIIPGTIIEYLPEEQNQDIVIDFDGGEGQLQDPGMDTMDVDLQLPNGENIADVSEQEIGQPPNEF